MHNKKTSGQMIHMPFLQRIPGGNSSYYITIVDANGGNTPDPGSNLWRLHIEGYLGKWNYKGLTATNTNIGAAVRDFSYFPLRFCPGQAGVLTGIFTSDHNFASTYAFNPHQAPVATNFYNTVIAQHPPLGGLGGNTQAFRAGVNPTVVWSPDQ